MESMTTNKSTSFIKSTLGIVVLCIIALIIGFFGGMEYKAYQIRKVITNAFGDASKTFQSNNQTQPNQNLSKGTDKANAIEKAVGDTISVQGFNLKITGVKEEATATSNFGSTITPNAGAKFVVLYMDVTDTGKTNLTFMPDDYITVVDSQGRQFTEDGSNSYFDKDLVNMGLAPGITQSGIIAYQLPSDASSYSLSVSDTGSSQAYKVKLQ